MAVICFRPAKELHQFLCVRKTLQKSLGHLSCKKYTMNIIDIPIVPFFILLLLLNFDKSIIALFLALRGAWRNASQALVPPYHVNSTACCFVYHCTWEVQKAREITVPVTQKQHPPLLLSLPLLCLLFCCCCCRQWWVDQNCGICNGKYAIMTYFLVRVFLLMVLNYHQPWLTLNTIK